MGRKPREISTAEALARMARKAGRSAIGGGGSTMYDPSARSGRRPTGASGHVQLRGEDAGRGHGTQYYDDGYRVSRDTDGQGDSRVHWTNQNLGRKHDDRHTPPPDAQY